MSPQDALLELLDRVAALGGGPVFMRALELAEWPREAVIALVEAELIRRAPPASSAICPGCEEACSQPVLLPAQTGRDTPVIFCDQRSDTHAVTIPEEALVQWQTSGTAVADVLARLLGLRQSGSDEPDLGRWEVGLLRGRKHASHLVLVLKDRLELQAAGHSIPLAEVLFVDGNALSVDATRLKTAVDQPVAAAGDEEFSAHRRARLKQRKQELIANGVRAFLKVLAEEEGVSTSRIKQLLKAE